MVLKSDCAAEPGVFPAVAAVVALAAVVVLAAVIAIAVVVVAAASAAAVVAWGRESLKLSMEVLIDEVRESVIEEQHPFATFLEDEVQQVVIQWQIRV